MPLTPTDNKAISTLLAFTPRQVLLGSQTMKHRSDDNGSSNGTVSLKLEQKVLLHQSIAHYLERSGFSKTLKKFRSEAQIEKDNLDGTLVDLEEMCLKYLEICKNVKANNNNLKEQVPGKHPKESGEDNLIADMENASKKKKKKTNKSDRDAVFHQSGTDENFKGPSKNSVEMTNGTGPESKVIYKEMDTDNKCNKKKKRKSKLTSESLSSGVEGKQFESQPMVIEVKLTDDASATAKTVNGETEKRSKDKKKRDKPSSDGDAEELQIGETNKTDSKKDNFKTSNEDASDKMRKDSKKRKRLTSDKIDVLPADGKADDEPKRRKIKNLNESERDEQSAKMNGSLKNDSNSNEENIRESVQCCDQEQKTSPEEFNGKANGDLGNTGEKSSIQRSQKKKQKGSVEQKEVKAFQRVKADEVEFADERLQDNSYWAKGGAESGYGAKAEEILSQVRGRDFRHEKTKKKRGSYRGGQIDLQSHSIKFSYSDDE